MTEYQRTNAKGEIIKETVNVEVQTSNHRNFTDRILAYSGRLYSDQLDRGDTYKKLHPVYSLVFSTQNLKEFAQIKDDYRHVCNIRRIKEPQVVMSRGMCFVIVELGKFTTGLAKAESTRDEWAYMIKNSKSLKLEDCKQFLKKGGEMAEALKHLWDISKDKKLRAAAMSRDKERRDRLAEREEHWEDGHQKGEAKGRQEGRKEGRQEREKEIARDLLAAGTGPEFVAKVTKLTLAEIEELIKNQA